MSKLYTVIAALVFLAAVAGVSGFKGYQSGVKFTKADWNADIAARTAAQEKANKEIITYRKKVKHENQSRDHDALVRNGCKRGWVRDFENCPANSR